MIIKSIQQKQKLSKEAGTKAEEKVNAAKTELEGKITTAKTALEAKDQEQDGKIADLETKYNSATDIKAANDRFTALEDADRAHDEALTGINNKISEIKKDIQDNDEAIDTISETVTKHAEMLNSHTTDLEKMGESVNKKYRGYWQN